MALSNITIRQTEGNTRILTSNDNKSGLIVYSNSAAFTGGTVTVYSAQEADSLGITTEDHPIAKYHVDEFYRANPSGELTIHLVEHTTGDTHNFSEVYTLVAAVEDISQIGVYTNGPLSTGMVSALQAVLTDLKENEYTPIVALLQANISDVSLASLPDFSNSSAEQVAVLIGQDGGNRGAQLFNTIGDTIGVLGLALGVLAVSSVHESIAWVGAYDVSGAECNTLAFGNGVSYKNVSKTQLGTLNDKGMIFLLKHKGLNGSYFSSSSAATTESSDFHSLERNRVSNKASKQLRTSLLPQLNAPLYLQEDGTLRMETVGLFTSKGDQALAGMLRDGEVSNYSIYIDPTQDVTSDDQLDIVVKLQPVGVAKFIDVTLSFAVSLA